MNPSDKNSPQTGNKTNPSDKLDRILHDQDLSPEEYRNLKEELRKNRRRLDGAGENPFENLLDED